jgi:hypothetical protein
VTVPGRAPLARRPLGAVVCYHFHFEVVIGRGRKQPRDRQHLAAPKGAGKPAPALTAPRHVRVSARWPREGCTMPRPRRLMEGTCLSLSTLASCTFRAFCHRSPASSGLAAPGRLLTDIVRALEPGAVTLEGQQRVPAARQARRLDRGPSDTDRVKEPGAGGQAGGTGASSAARWPSALATACSGPSSQPSFHVAAKASPPSASRWASTVASTVDQR